MHYLLFYTSAAKHLARLSSAESTAHNFLSLSSVWREKVEEDLSWLALTPQRKYSQRAAHSVRTRLDGSKESRHQAPLVSELTGTRYRWVLRWLEERMGISGSSTARRLVTLSVECSRAKQSYHSLRHISHLTVSLVGVAAPGAPADIKVAVSSSNSLVVSWLPPNDPNGLITKYNLYNRWLSHSTHIEQFWNICCLPINALFIASFLNIVLVWTKSGNTVYSWIFQTIVLIFDILIRPKENKTSTPPH